MTYLYFIGEPDGGPVKVGISLDVAKRLAQLQGGNARRLVIEAAVEIPEGIDPLRFEAGIHTVLRFSRMQGEWFGRNPVLEDIRDHLVRDGVAEWLSGWEVWAGSPFLSSPASS